MKLHGFVQNGVIVLSGGHVVLVRRKVKRMPVIAQGLARVVLAGKRFR